MKRMNPDQTSQQEKEGCGLAGQPGFSQKYERLMANTKFRKVLDQSETIQQALPSHDGPQGGKGIRHLTDSGQTIIGLQQKLDEQISYINDVGRTHLADNDFRSQKQYDELDVVHFDKNEFGMRLRQQ